MVSFLLVILREQSDRRISCERSACAQEILRFGRSGLISRGIFHVENNVYGLSGLAFVQLITFFPVAFLLFEGMLRALDPALEEAAMNLGATRWRIFWT